MKGVWKWSLGLSLGLLAGGAHADDRPAASLDRPVAVSGSAVTTPAPAASLGRPVAVTSSPAAGVTDAQVKPVAFSWPSFPSFSAVARGSSPEAPKPMPVGTPVPEEGVLKMPTPITSDSGPSLAPGAVPPPPGAVGLPPGAVVGTPPGPGVPLSGPCCADSGVCDGSCCIEADSGCGPECCATRCIGLDHTFYVSAEYLLWFFKDSPAPPLVTRALDYSGTVPGAVSDFPHTIVVFGGGPGIDTHIHSGARFTAGGWLDDEQLLGLEGVFFFTGQRGAHFTAGSESDVGFYRPFIDQATGMAVAEEVSGLVPRQLAGRVTVDLESRLWGAEANFRHNLLCGCWYRVDLVEGFRFQSLEESLNISEQGLTVLDMPAVAGGMPQGTTFQVNDRFSTQNRFYGGQIGTISEVKWGSWFLDVKSKVALGDTRQNATIIGNTTIGSNFLPGSSPMPGGLLALASNSGLHTRDRFSVVTDLGLNIGYQINDQLRVYAGYEFLYWSSVLRPGDQIDPVVNRGQLPGASQTIVSPSATGTGAPRPHPIYAFHGTDFWAHGVNFGLEFRY